MSEVNHDVKQPFKEGDVIRQYHHKSMFDDFLMIRVQDNGGLIAKKEGVIYGLSAHYSVLSPNQDPSVANSKTKNYFLKIFNRFKKKV